MNKLIIIIAACMMLLMGTAAAHDDHGKINGKAAVAIAIKAVNKMTFKDLGFEIGKLDKTWKGLDAANFTVVDVQEKAFIVKAKNTNNDKNVYFTIAKNGQVLSAKSTLD